MRDRLYKIKPIEWTLDGSVHKSASAVATYKIYEEGSMNMYSINPPAVLMTISGSEEVRFNCFQVCSNVDHAKQICEQHYMNQMKSCLEDS